MFFDLMDILVNITRILYKYYNKEDLSEEDITFLKENQTKIEDNILKNPLYDIGNNLEKELEEELSHYKKRLNYDDY